MMNTQNLPEQFRNNMRRLLGEEYDTFLAEFSGERKNALRLNRLKIQAEEFEETAPFPVERVPWTDNGYYVDYRDMPSRHPWYRAGVYYLQEPSAMASASILPVNPGDRVLDLCAAPGGKATELGARLGGRGLLIANEISPSRARALMHNIELFGITNSVVTNEPPGRLLPRFEAFFDAVLVDAPCSGEGMFRKDEAARKAWYPEKVAECAKIQREIILQACDMLKEGGHLVYSTCTFEPEENELVIAHLLRERPEMELLQIPISGGRESFSRAYSMERLLRRGFELPSGSAPEDGPDLEKTVRIWPHCAGGEGHYIALLQKRILPATGAGADLRNRTAADSMGIAEGRMTTASLRSDGGGTLTGNRDACKKAGSRKENSRKKDFRKKDNRSQLAEQFLAQYASDLHIDMNRCEIREDHVYLMPEDCPDLRGLRFLRSGLHLGELKKNRFEPSQELAMALPDHGVDEENRIRLSARDERLAAFFRGETIRIDGAGGNGWRLVCADRWPVGWGKLAGGVVKNHIPAGWRVTV